jgi:hypothetical protein
MHSVPEGAPPGQSQQAPGGGAPGAVVLRMQTQGFKSTGKWASNRIAVVDEMDTTL